MTASTTPTFAVRPISSHFFGLMWFVNLCSPYLNIALNRPDIPNFVYAAIMVGMVMSLFLYKQPLTLVLPRLAWKSGLYLAYTTLLVIAWGSRQESWGFLAQGISAIFALTIFRHPREYRIILSWIAFGMAGFGAFLVWQSITGYKPPWLTTIHFLHDVGTFIRAGEGFGEKNYSAALLVLGVVIVWGMTAYQQFSLRLALTLLTGCVLGFLYTFSRGALVTLGFVLVCYGLRSIRNFRNVTLTGFLILPIALYFAGDVLGLFVSRLSITSHQDFIQAFSRWEQILGAFDMVVEASLTELIIGHGPFVYVNEIIIHNTPIGLLVEQGIFGFLFWLWLIATIFYACLISFRCGNPYPMMALFGFLMAGMFIRIEVERMFWLMVFFVHAFPKLIGYCHAGSLPKRSTGSLRPRNHKNRYI